MSTNNVSTLRNWTMEHRKAQAQRIQQWQPSVLSAGSKRAEGKVTASKNAYKGGARPMLRKLLFAQGEVLVEFGG